MLPVVSRTNITSTEGFSACTLAPVSVLGNAAPNAGILVTVMRKTTKITVKVLLAIFILYLLSSSMSDDWIIKNCLGKTIQRNAKRAIRSFTFLLHIF
jgi:hypothetical protein